MSENVLLIVENGSTLNPYFESRALYDRMIQAAEVRTQECIGHLVQFRRFVCRGEIGFSLFRHKVLASNIYDQKRVKIVGYVNILW